MNLKWKKIKILFMVCPDLEQYCRFKWLVWRENSWKGFIDWPWQLKLYNLHSFVSVVRFWRWKEYKSLMINQISMKLNMRIILVKVILVNNIIILTYTRRMKLKKIVCTQIIIFFDYDCSWEYLDAHYIIDAVNIRV